MTKYILLICAALILLLVAGLFICIKLIKKAKKEIKDQKKAIESARDELRRLVKYQKEKEEIKKDADTKKDSLHTGNDDADFNNSLKLLHGSASRDKTGSAGT
jgi:septal ring factor EnvC (AmiA/AmiB activator)